MKLLEGRSLCLDLDGRRVLEHVSIDLEPGEILGLIGPNGAGKSCLLRLLAGLHRPHAGSLQLAGSALLEMPPEVRAREIAWLAQQGEVHWPISVETLVEFGRSPRRAPWQPLGDEDRAVVERILEETQLTDLRDRSVESLSGGERARALLARALAGAPRLLLADEPLAALDPAHQLDVMQLLRGHCSQNRGIILVLHDLRFAAGFCHRLLLLHQGRVVAYGTPEQVLTAEHLASTYQIELCEWAREPFSLPWRRG